ncbi:MAG: glycerol kinase, partial [Solobacterium sp.]|nr:glycerol kinase [Solobacterium sp.]
MEKFILAIDQGTTSCRAILFDHDSKIRQVAQREFTQIFRQPGWVEHDANEIFLTVESVMASCLQNAGVQPEQVAAVGITNQRETTVVWNKETGLPIANAIVWQSRQTAEICDDLRSRGYEDLIRSRTGLRIDPYFSASKIRWILDHTEGGQQMAEEGRLLAGTIDTWLIYRLSGGTAHVTDYSNASRTMLYNIFEKKWDERILELLDIPACM